MYRMFLLQRSCCNIPYISTPLRSGRFLNRYGSSAGRQVDRCGGL